MGFKLESNPNLECTTSLIQPRRFKSQIISRNLIGQIIRRTKATSKCSPNEGGACRPPLTLNAMLAFTMEHSRPQFEVRSWEEQAERSNEQISSSALSWVVSTLTSSTPNRRLNWTAWWPTGGATATATQCDLQDLCSAGECNAWKP